MQRTWFTSGAQSALRFKSMKHQPLKTLLSRKALRGRKKEIWDWREFMGGSQWKFISWVVRGRESVSGERLAELKRWKQKRDQPGLWPWAGWVGEG